VVSIQFNCHHLGDRRGILKPFSALAAPALMGVPVHIFFHELWFNAYQKSSLSNWLKGLIRRHYFVQLVRSVPPEKAFTNTEVYARQLGRLGIRAEVVPIYSSIPVLDLPDSHKSIYSNSISAVIFGTLPPHWRGERVIRKLGELARSQGKELRVVGMGRHGYDDLGWDRLRNEAAQHALFYRIGVVSDAEASTILSSADFGISVTDFEYLSKSTTVAAMLEHGLPVIFEARPRLRLAGSRAALDSYKNSSNIMDKFLITELGVCRFGNVVDSYLASFANIG
jgi:hypothetical protein